MNTQEIFEVEKELNEYIDQVDWLETQIAINTTPVNLQGILETLRKNFWKKYESLFLKYFRAYGTNSYDKFPYDCYYSNDGKFGVKNFYGYFHLTKIISINSAVMSVESPDDYWKGYPDYYISGDFPEIVMMLYIIKQETQH